MSADDIRVGDLADRDADLLGALGGQLIDDHRSVPSAASRADQPTDIRLAGTAPPDLSDHGARKDDLDRPVQHLIENAEQQRGTPLQCDERTCVEDEPPHAACPARPVSC
jgi:hypothetical protein